MIGLLIAVLRVYQLIVLIRAILSWIDAREQGVFVQFIHAVTEPVLAPLRRVLVFGNVDASPLAVILLIQLLIGAL